MLCCPGQCDQAPCEPDRARSGYEWPNPTDLISRRWLRTQQVPYEVIPSPAHHVRLVSEPVSSIRQKQEIEVLVGGDERVHHEHGVRRRAIEVKHFRVCDRRPSVSELIVDIVERHIGKVAD